ncbi:hypothetical protein ILYODFUR_031604 [Ilyodon furcidens]|uniref:Uncharacterized protein n=1 Tax=Ilyodon furcidens TaxID=33524 RepID=A0ABV0SRJ1_9TELE
MSKPKGGGLQGDNIQDALLVSKGDESTYECVCVCDVWFPGATNGADESRGHYVEAVRALETLPSVFLCFPLFYSSHPSAQTRTSSQRLFSGSNENRAGSV